MRYLEDASSFAGAWGAFWERWRGIHSLLRCPGPDVCPGGCALNARDELAALLLEHGAKVEDGQG